MFEIFRTNGKGRGYLVFLGDKGEGRRSIVEMPEEFLQQITPSNVEDKVRMYLVFS